jgi:hypothetical protein
MKLGYKGRINTRNKFPKEVFPSPKISLLILDELEELGFGEIGRSLRDSWGYSHGFTPMMEVDDEAHLTPNSKEGIKEKLLQTRG